MDDPWTLVHAAQAGDSDAFGKLWVIYHPSVLRYMRSRLPRFAGRYAEDLASDTFLKAWGHIGDLKYEGRDPGAWLITIARNVWLDWGKSSERRSHVCGEEEILDRLIGVTPGQGADYEYITASEATAIPMYVEALLERICPEQAGTLRLRYYGEMRWSEVAEQLGEHEGASKARAHRAMRSLQRKVKAGSYSEALANLPTQRRGIWA